MSAQVIIYSKPTCPYCIRAKQLLQRKNVEFTDIDVSRDENLYNELKARTNHRTVPQIFIGDQFIGGSDNLHALEQSGELDKLLAG